MASVYLGSTPIENIGVITSAGIDTSDATATAADMANGTTAYVNGQKITGTAKTVLAGKSVGWASKTPVTRSSDGKIGFVSTVNESNYSGILWHNGSSVFVYSDPANFGDATASDVVAGKTFTSSSGLKIEGTAIADSFGTGTDTTDATATAVDIVLGETAYANGEKLTGSMEKIESSMVFNSPTLTYNNENAAIDVEASFAQRYCMDNGSTAIMRCASSNFGNATASDVLAGKTFTSAAGLLAVGTAILNSTGDSSNVTNCGIADIVISSDITGTSPVQFANISFVAEHINDEGLFLILIPKNTNAAATNSVAFAVSMNTSRLNGGHFLTIYKTSYTIAVQNTTGASYAANSSTAGTYARIYADANGNIYALPYTGGSTWSTTTINFAAGEYSLIYGTLS